MPRYDPAARDPVLACAKGGARMFHLLVLACTADSVCAERWLPAADAATRPACEAAALPLLTPWLGVHDLTGRTFRCVDTAALPALALQEVTPGVLVHLGPAELAHRSNGGRIANLGVVIGPAGIAVIDPGGSRAQGEELLAAIRRRSALPVTVAVVSHVHPDHSLGAEVFREAGARILGHARLGDALSARVGSYTTAYRDIIGPQAFHGGRFVLPDESLAAPAEVDFGGDRLRLIPAPTAHTDNDIAVWHEASGTLFTGDLLFRDLTPVLDGSITGWLDWLGTKPEPPPRRIVPGHGPVAAEWTEASDPTRGYLEALASAVRGAIADDLSLSEAVPAVVEALRPQAAGWAEFADTTRRNAAAAYKELEWE